MKNKGFWGRLLIALSIFSLLIALLEGWFYYAPRRDTPFFYALLILQNAIKAFSFKTDISLNNVISSLSADMSVVQLVVSYAYGVVVFLAPFCTLTFCYNVVNKALHLFLLVRRRRKLPCTLIFGYNENVQSLLSKSSDKLGRIHLITRTKLSTDEERALMKKGVTPHHYDYLAMDGAQISKTLDLLKAPKAAYIVLMEDSSATNFSLFLALAKHSDKFNPNTKCYCHCDDAGIRMLLEDYFDNTPNANKAAGGTGRLDLEVFSLPELQVRELFSMHPLNHCYKDTQTPPEKQDVHLLIVGFGQVGQQVLLQAMNQGVTHSRNRILIDVVDHQMDQKRNIFANRFQPDYVEIKPDHFRIQAPSADGEFLIRFHSMDVTYDQFRTLLAKVGVPSFTYVAICLQDTSLGIHCTMVLQRFLAQHQTTDLKPPICLRMDSDFQMADYLEKNENTLGCVCTMPSQRELFSFDALFHIDRDKQARNFQQIYERISLACGTLQDSASPNEGDSWHTLRLFQRDSNRALALHKSQKEALLKTADSSLLAGTEISLLEKKSGNGVNQYFFAGSEAELAKRMQEVPDILEMAKMEHRRWCYFMASQGWSWGQVKDVHAQQNPCMSDWKTLYAQHPEMCKYDLIPFLMLLEKSKENKKDNQERSSSND